MSDLSSEDDKALEAFANYGAELAAAIASIASDVALVIDHDGIVRSVASGANGMQPALEQWVGQRWADTVTSETRRKIDLLLSEASSGGVSKRREVTHPSQSGGDIPMTYAAIRLGERGPVLVAGRDLRPFSAIQQRFIESQKELERSYWVQRQAEAHYRLLFQVATDAVLVIDAQSLAVVDANPAARELLGGGEHGLVGTAVTTCIAPRYRPNVEEMLATSRSIGKPAEVRVRLGADASPVIISATPFRGEHDMLLLLRMSRAGDHARFTNRNAAPAPAVADAVVVTDGSGRVVMTNPTFVELVGAGSEAQVKGQLLSQWVEGFDRQIDGVLERINRQGIATTETSIIRSDHQMPIDVDLSAAMLTDGERLHIGISLRRRHIDGLTHGSDDFSEQINSLAQKLGQLSLDEMLAQVTELAETHFVCEALTRTNGDRTAAAELLGITASRLRDGLTQDLGQDDADHDGLVLH